MEDILFPTISVGGKDRVVRFSIAAQLLMSRRGLDIFNLPGELARKIDATTGAPIIDLTNFAGDSTPNPRYAQNIISVFSACVAENFIDTSNPDKVDLSKAPTADYWATQLHPLQFEEVEAKVIEALGKVAAARKPRLQVVAPPNQNEVAS